ncbi:MAG: N-acetylglucosamine-6-phosphate deacetylase [bacterium]
METVAGVKNAKIMTPNGIIEDGYLLIENGKISSLGKMNEMNIQKEDIIDANRKWVFPGFIDLHCHGAMGCDVMDGSLSDIETIAEYHAGGGTTAFLPTTASSSLENILNALKTIQEAKSKVSVGAIVLGAHIEGPFFNYSKRGCHLPIYVRNPRPIEYERILEYSDAIISMTLAPELDGAEGLMKALSKNGIIISLGHSEATYDDVLKAIECGATHVTHLYCAMSTIIKSGPARIIGLVESTLLLDELTTEIIADGKHLPPELLRMIIKAKGIDRLCVVTDAMRGAGMPPGVYTFGPKDGQPAIVQDGMAIMPDRTGYASSVVRMNDLVKTLIGPVGLSIPDAIEMASTVPAKIIGMENVMGSIEIGKNANIIIADDNIEVYKTIINGKKVFDKNS